jgi:hypothetical protein
MRQVALERRRNGTARRSAGSAICSCSASLLTSTTPSTASEWPLMILGGAVHHNVDAQATADVESNGDRQSCCRPPPARADCAGAPASTTAAMSITLSDRVRRRLQPQQSRVGPCSADSTAVGSWEQTRSKPRERPTTRVRIARRATVGVGTDTPQRGRQEPTGPRPPPASPSPS